MIQNDWSILQIVQHMVLAEQDENLRDRGECFFNDPSIGRG
jgi:hypothetical protein